MKAEIDQDGNLFILAETKTELYAIEKWHEENIDGCTLKFKEDKKAIIYYDYINRHPVKDLIDRLNRKYQLYIYGRAFNKKLRNGQSS